MQLTYPLSNRWLIVTVTTNRRSIAVDTNDIFYQILLSLVRVIAAKLTEWMQSHAICDAIRLVQVNSKTQASSSSNVNLYHGTNKTGASVIWSVIKHSRE